MAAQTLTGPGGRQATSKPITREEVAAGLAGEFADAKDQPQVGPRLVRRPRLLDRLLRSPPARLVLLTAPAGYSKTSCLAEWEAAEKRPFAWLTAHARHDDAAVLLASIVELLEEIEPVSPEVMATLATGDSGISTAVLPRLGRSLRHRAKPFVLVIDDLHSVTSPVALEVLRTVAEHLPAGAQLALASRTEPALSLGRMRAHRQLVELTRADLSMTRPESGELLREIGIELNSAQLDVLFERTEGWPAALYLAGLALAGQSDLSAAVASFGGDDRIVADYLRDEFLADTTPGKLSFLTRSSVLDELSGPLCDAVLDRSGSARVLRELARSNSLVVSLDRRDDRYRYHHLFAEMLRSELRSDPDGTEAKLHARASRWYAAHSDPHHAIDHAIAAGGLERAGELIWHAYPEVSGRGRIATLVRWLERIGNDSVAASPALALSAAHTHLSLGRGDRAAHWARVAAGIAKSADESESIQADIHLMDALLAMNGVVQMDKDAARASELHPAEAPWQSACYLLRGVASHLTGHPERALPMLQEGVHRGSVASPIVEAVSLAQLCLIAAEDGDWDRASRLIAQAREQTGRCGLGDYPSVAIVPAASAFVHSHEGRVERAHADSKDAQRLLALLTEFPPWYEAEARLVLSRAYIRLDNLVSGRVLLDEASLFLQQTPDAIILRQWLAASTAALKSASTKRQEREWSLTKAELRTLQFLPSHLSFREIGERIHVSPNTVKTQAQAVYRKLDASSRAEAVVRARDAGLLGEATRDLMRTG
jgi:LuxR family transcriptional regulator, maltose regulon positive regulatory protein